jgi:hypothetical protein
MDSIQDTPRGVAKDQRPQTEHVINIDISVHIDHLGAFGPTEGQRNRLL